MATLTFMFACVPSVLNELKRRGMLTTIVSTKFRYRIESILARERLTDAFEVVVGGEDVAAHKPNPEGLNTALAKLGAAAVNALYVGDHPVDADAAAAAGVRFFAVLSGSAVESDFAGGNVDRFLSSLDELPPLLP